MANDSFEIRGGSLAGWYFLNSRVWLSPTHSGLKRDKRLSKKFGTLERSVETVLGLMVKRYMDEAWRWIVERTHEPEEMEEVAVKSQAFGGATFVGPQNQERQSRVMRDGEDVVMGR